MIKRNKKYFLEKISGYTALILITAIFLTGTSLAYIGHSPSLEVDINSVEKFKNGSTDSYTRFQVNLTNHGDKNIHPRIRVITNTRSGPFLVDTDEDILEPGETRVYNGSIRSTRNPVTFSSDYQIIVHEQGTDSFNRTLIENNKDFSLEKNPSFLKSDLYPYHWAGSTYGNGNYNTDNSGNGLNASFSECGTDSACGFTYRDDFELKPQILFEGRGSNLKGTDLELVVEDREESIVIPVETGREFSSKINLREIYRERGKDFSKGREVTYQVRFRTEKQEFHWIDIQKYDFRDVK